MSPKNDPTIVLETSQILADLQAICCEFSSLDVDTLSIPSELVDPFLCPIGDASCVPSEVRFDHA